MHLTVAAAPDDYTPEWTKHDTAERFDGAPNYHARIRISGAPAMTGRRNRGSPNIGGKQYR